MLSTSSKGVLLKRLPSSIQAHMCFNSMVEHPSRQDGTYLSLSLARVNRTGTQLGYGHPLDPAGLRLSLRSWTLDICTGWSRQSKSRRLFWLTWWTWCHRLPYVPFGDGFPPTHLCFQYIYRYLGMVYESMALALPRYVTEDPAMFQFRTMNWWFVSDAFPVSSLGEQWDRLGIFWSFAVPWQHSRHVKKR